MKIEEYISSGILELYCAGALTDAECREVEEMATKHPEIHAELQSIQAALDKLSENHSLQPPAFVKEKIMRAIEEDSIKTFAGNGQQESQVVPVRRISEGWLRYAAAASVTLFIISSGFAIYFSAELSKAKRQLAALEQQQKDNNQQIAYLTDYTDTLQHNIAVMNDMHTVKVVLKGVPSHDGMAVMVYWNPQSKTVMLDPGNLPAPPEGMQYQLWSIGKSGPVDAGVFVTDSSMHKMKDVTEAAAFAITLEKSGGSPVPTLTQMYVVGNVSI